VKKLLIVLLVYGCNIFDRDIEMPEYPDSTVHLIEQDSILRLADEALEQIQIGEENRKDMIAQIQEQMDNKELSNQQIQELQQQQNQIVMELEEANKRKITEKDSIIYNIKYVDKKVYSEVRIPVYVYDTVHKEIIVLDTTKVKKLKKKKK
jgi:hypothetical protein